MEVLVLSGRKQILPAVTPDPRGQPINVLVLLFSIYGDVSKCRLEFSLYYSNLKRHEIIDLILKVRVEFPCSHSAVWQEKGDPQQSTLRAPSASPSHNTDVNWALILGSLSLTRRITQLSADVVGLYGSSLHSNLMRWRRTTKIQDLKILQNSQKGLKETFRRQSRKTLL